LAELWLRDRHHLDYNIVRDVLPGARAPLHSKRDSLHRRRGQGDRHSREVLFVNTEFDLYVAGSVLKLRDGDTATVGFVEASAEFVIIRVRFSSFTAMRKYASTTTLQVEDALLPWENSTSGSGPLAPVAEMVFHGSIPAGVRQITLNLQPIGEELTSQQLSLRPVAG